MSEWYEAEDDEIYIYREDRQVDIFVKADNNGRTYVSLTFAQIKHLAELIGTDF